LEETRTCLNFLARRTARILARHYDDALRPHGLRSTQFNVMAVLAQKGTTTTNELAQIMALERSALARNLKPLERQGFVVVDEGKDRRTRIATLSAKGRRKLLRALPAWSTAQDAAKDLFGADNVDCLVRLAQSIDNSMTH
jgi:DNA-binding MarR family transcriptional regulator